MVAERFCLCSTGSLSGMAGYDRTLFPTWPLYGLLVGYSLAGDRDSAPEEIRFQPVGRYAL